jgi:hypothetical protein
MTQKLGIVVKARVRWLVCRSAAEERGFISSQGQSFPCPSEEAARR